MKSNIRPMNSARNFLFSVPRGYEVENLLARREGYTSSGRLVAVETKFYAVAHSTCGSSIWYLLHVTLPASRILRWILA
jgi:hypothetical protein